MRAILSLSFIILLSLNVCAVTFSGSNVPYDSSFHIGLVSGPGTGLDLGADIYFPLENISVGGGLEQQVTNTEYEQNINIFRYHLGAKYSINENIFLTFSFGSASFYLTKAVDYVDSLTGSEHSMDEASYGHATYYSIAPNFVINDYILTPKFIVNNIIDGGSLFEINLNLGHKF